VRFDYPPEIQRVIYTTNAIESLNYTLRKRLKTRGVFPNDESIMKVLYLALHNVAKKWTRPIRDWKAAFNQIVILFGQRGPMSKKVTQLSSQPPSPPGASSSRRLVTRSIWFR
jgi:transposase-like protein